MQFFMLCSTKFVSCKGKQFRYATYTKRKFVTRLQDTTIQWNYFIPIHWFAMWMCTFYLKKERKQAISENSQVKLLPLSCSGYQALSNAEVHVTASLIKLSRLRVKPRLMGLVLGLGDPLVVPHPKLLLLSISMLISHDVATIFLFANQIHFKAVF